MRTIYIRLQGIYAQLPHLENELVQIQLLIAGGRTGFPSHTFPRNPGQCCQIGPDFWKQLRLPDWAGNIPICPNLATLILGAKAPPVS